LVLIKKKYENWKTTKRDRGSALVVVGNEARGLHGLNDLDGSLNVTGGHLPKSMTQ